MKKKTGFDSLMNVKVNTKMKNVRLPLPYYDQTHLHLKGERNAFISNNYWKSCLQYLSV